MDKRDNSNSGHYVPHPTDHLYMTGADYALHDNAEDAQVRSDRSQMLATLLIVN